MSQLLSYFQSKQFCILVEYLTASTQHSVINSQIAGYPTVMTLADRVQTDHDLAPLEASKTYPNRIDKVLHFAGKGRDIEDFERFLKQAQASQINNLLLLTGDKLKGHCSGQGGAARTRYLESVNAVMAAKQLGGFVLGVAFNPFKYAEAERDAQYLKLHKKLKAGADFIVTQLGYDMAALKQAKAFLKQHDYSQKILACVMPLSLGRAKFITKNKVAGIVITAHMLKVLADEQQLGHTAHVYMRCALQVLMCERLGFAGIHLSSCHTAQEQQQLAHYIQQYRHLDLDALEAHWHALWQVDTDRAFQPQLSCYSRQPSSSQLIQYQQLHVLHAALFDSKVAKGLGRFILKQSFWNKKLATHALVQTEKITKHHTLGCESCGQCRLGDTLYICPETCPKGLANGPCGGTTLDRCEFEDRECIHSVKARLAQAVGQTDILKEKLIPTVAIAVRGSSAWKNWYLDSSS